MTVEIVALYICLCLDIHFILPILYLFTAFAVSGEPPIFMNIFIHGLKCLRFQIKKYYEFSVMTQNIIFLKTFDIFN
jgi:hypothetical protein